EPERGRKTAGGSAGKLRSPFDTRHLVTVEPAFPLTLTLSLGEREQKSMFSARCYAQATAVSRVMVAVPLNAALTLVTMFSGVRPYFLRKSSTPVACSMN